MRDDACHDRQVEMQKAGSGRWRGFEGHGGFSGRNQASSSKISRVGCTQISKVRRENGYTAEAILESFSQNAYREVWNKI